MTKKPVFQLYKVLDPLRDDYEVLNANYKNMVLFTWKKEAGKIYAFNFCTLFFYEMARHEVEILDYKDEVIQTIICYRVKEHLHVEVPNMFISYNYHKQYRKSRKVEIVETRKNHDLRGWSVLNH
jgi:hypothetical protein